MPSDFCATVSLTCDKERRCRTTFRFPAGSLIFLYRTASRATLQYVSRVISPGNEWLGDGFGISFTSSSEAKNACIYTGGPLHVFMVWWLISLRDDSCQLMNHHKDLKWSAALLFYLCKRGISKIGSERKRKHCGDFV